MRLENIPFVGSYSKGSILRTDILHTINYIEMLKGESKSEQSKKIVELLDFASNHLKTFIEGHSVPKKKRTRVKKVIKGE